MVRRGSGVRVPASAPREAPANAGVSAFRPPPPRPPWAAPGPQWCPLVPVRAPPGASSTAPNAGPCGPPSHRYLAAAQGAFPERGGHPWAVSGMPSSGAKWLHKRVSEFDSGEIAPGLGDEPIVRFVRLMVGWTNTRMTFDPERPVVLEPAAADGITAECRLLKEIARTDADLVRGPLEQRRQEWIGTAKRSGSAASPELTRQSFVSADAAAHVGPSTKPAGVGIYSSTAASDGRSMWRGFLEIGPQARLHPPPGAGSGPRPGGARAKG